MSAFFDSHCHLDDARFAEDVSETVSRMRAGGVSRCVTVGSDVASSERCIAIAREYDGVYAASGVHPHEAKDAPGDYLDRLSALLTQQKVVALGEIGLDYYYDLSPRDMQMRVFLEQLELSYQLSVPAIFHIRDAHGDILTAFRARGKALPSGIIHCFSGSTEVALEYVRMGFYISFSGPLTFKKAPNLWEAAKAVPLERLLVETDSPYLAPEPLRGKRNEPANVRYVAQKLAELRGLSVEDMARITTENALRVYHLKEDTP